MSEGQNLLTDDDLEDLWDAMAEEELAPDELMWAEHRYYSTFARLVLEAARDGAEATIRRYLPGERGDEWVERRRAWRARARRQE